MDTNKWAFQINEEVKDLFDLFGDEYLIPPMFACLHMTGLCLANVVAMYERADKEIPKELEDFLEKGLPDLFNDYKNMIEEQYLALNTKGTA